MNTMKRKDYNKLSKVEKKAFKKAGGKVKDSLLVNILAIFILICIFGGIARCSSKPKEKSEPMPWDASESACLTLAKQKDTSLFDLSVESSKSLKKGGYKITVRVEQDKARADLGVVCYTKEDGTITNVDTILLKKKR
ncbi:hypothetical protein V9J34_001343 [Salmonella enterica]|uniref:Uncharacterized protein n=1 Tax=Salmonella enterica subsp. enterica serovar Abeokuta TaxID=2926665 RepID=A0A8T9IE46_SALET|nr:hypothetical protein [Salmonella enterica]ECE5860674.1 hypothetical protein [Salmonella enterica subsp. enterica]SQJ25051.1 Uncharacterised protein [Salmonella enterica subsp. enterica] [Salmonella enterica subsp. enterica serovar Menston]ECE1929300.1 hypothetical protein [Salmonella enterica]EDW9823542.1 hypothetical protein [Salmonella enterica]EKC9955233.1 hypothetical protein [Salmonella enterica]